LFLAAQNHHSYCTVSPSGVLAVYIDVAPLLFKFMRALIWGGA
jgi:hypothetical protein